MASTMRSGSTRGQGEPNFSYSLSHRLPTVSAAQALQALESSPTRCISTGLEQLDAMLQNREPVSAESETCYGGVSRGKVTEVYGPPGVGKTALGMQLVTSALRTGEGVVWVDTSHPLCGTRLSQVLTASPSKLDQPANGIPPFELLDHLVHLTTPTLAHLLAILSDPRPSYVVENTSLLVIDSFSTLINSAFPRPTDASVPSKKPGAPNSSSRKLPILQYIINALQKLAATQNIAVLVISQCVTKMRPGNSALLIPSVNTTVWEQGLGCRIALYRDWGWDDPEGKPVDDVRFAQVVKAEGINLPESRTKPVGFSIDENGMKPLKLPSHPTFEPSQRTIPMFSHATPASGLPQKRKLAATDLEIPDSDDEDDEDYGWAEEDEQELPAPTPQWQGSEDILMRPMVGQLDEEEEDLDDEPEEEEEEEKAEVMPPRESKNFIGASRIITREIDDSEDELA